MADEAEVSSTDNPDPFAPADERVHEQGAIDGKTATPGATDEVVPDDERNPARHQSPAATDAQEAIMGDPGFREQQPTSGFGANTANSPFASSAPPPGAQHGVPLAEDRAAGVEPGPKGPIAGPGQAQPDASDAPDHDGSGGQSTTSNLGG